MSSAIRICPSCKHGTSVIEDIVCPHCYHILPTPSLPVIACKECSKEFTARQQNPSQYPKYCPACRVSYHPCVICGMPTPIGKKYCRSSCAQRDSSNMRIIEGHKRQSLAIKGEANPSKRPDVRMSISKGVKASYTPELRAQRASISHLPSTPSRRFDDGVGILLRSKLEVRVAEVLRAFSLGYQYEPSLRLKDGSYVYPDFLVLPTQGSPIYLEVTGYAYPSWASAFCEKVHRIRDSYPNLPVLVATYAQKARQLAKDLSSIHHVDVFAIGELPYAEMRKVYVGEFVGFDYSHVLPKHTGKCASLHGHSLKVQIGILGHIEQEKDWVIDFGIVKAAAKDVLSQIDHKLFISKEYVKNSSNRDELQVYWHGSQGDFDLRLPKSQALLLDNEATAETLSMYIAGVLYERLAGSVLGVEVAFFEGDANVAVAIYCGDEPEPHPLSALPIFVKYHGQLDVNNSLIEGAK